MRLLIVEDDRLLGDAIQAGLSHEGFAVDWVTDGLSAETALMVPGANQYAAMVLDLGLPRRDGLAVLDGLRRRGSALPVLILTARDTVEDRILGLDTGADDYLLKPFDMGELAARLRALIRRSEGKAAPRIALNGVVLDPAAHTVSVDDSPVELTAKEFALLHVLLLNAGRVMSRQQLEQHIYNWNDEAGSNTVEVYIHHLRRKLGRDLIRNMRGIGYFVDKG